MPFLQNHLNLMSVQPLEESKNFYDVHPNLVEVAGKGAMCGRELVDLMSLTICGSSWNHLQEYDSIMTLVLIEMETRTRTRTYIL